MGERKRERDGQTKNKPKRCPQKKRQSTRQNTILKNSKIPHLRLFSYGESRLYRQVASKECFIRQVGLWKFVANFILFQRSKLANEKTKFFYLLPLEDFEIVKKSNSRFSNQPNNSVSIDWFISQKSLPFFLLIWIWPDPFFPPSDIEPRMARLSMNLAFLSSLPGSAFSASPGSYVSRVCDTRSKYKKVSRCQYIDRKRHIV